MSEWWVGRQGANPVGPVTTDTLVRGILEKKVPEDALVCRVGEQQWQHLAQVDDLWELVHPEQFHTSVTKQPWFTEKGPSSPPIPPTDPPEPLEVEDESTRIYSVPILSIRSVDSSPSHPIPVKGNPQTAAVSPARTAEVQAPQQVPAAPAAAQQSAATHASTPRAAIPPPRFGLDRAVQAKPTPIAPQPSATTISKPEPAAAKAHVAALGPTLPSAPHPAAVVPARPSSPFLQQPSVSRAPAPPVPPSRPDNEVRESVPLIPVRPVAPQVPQISTVPIQQRPAIPTAVATPLQPRVIPPMPQEHAVAAIPPAPAAMPAAPAVAPAPAVRAFPHGVPPPTSAVPIASYARPATEPEDDTVTIVARAAPAIPPSPPAFPAPAPAPLPLIPEVEPAELFDEDFEPASSAPSTASHPAVHAPQSASSPPRPAAGTPAPPSVIITHRPPSMIEEVLAHAVAQLPEETRPALRSIHPPGTIQMSIGTLIIGALGLVVLVLLVVLLLR